MPSTLKVTLLAAALPIPGDPYCRMMGILISVDGKRCVSQLVKDVAEGQELLRNPLHREAFKAHGFDLSAELVRWVEQPASDLEYVNAANVFAGCFNTAKQELAKKQSEITAAPRN